MDENVFRHNCAYGEAEGLARLKDPGNAYNDLVRDHAMNPRNFGEMSPGLADGHVLLHDPLCKDRLELWLMVEDGRIFDIRFNSNGCPETIATCSMATELALGKTVAEAKKMRDADIIKALGYPALQHPGCTLVGVRALQAAIQDYEKKRAQKGPTLLKPSKGKRGAS